MPLDLAQRYIQHLNSILKWYEENADADDIVSQRVAHGIMARTEAVVEKITGKDSAYSRQLSDIIETNAYVNYKAEMALGIVEALKGDISDGYLDSLTALVHGEVFADFIDMAERLLNDGYKDAAAVIAGSTLESHLRQLCQNNGIDTENSTKRNRSRPKPASLLNQELGKTVYSLYDQKTVTAWLDLRNCAAHGKYGEYTDEQVHLFIEGLRDFMERYPA